MPALSNSMRRLQGMSWRVGAEICRLHQACPQHRAARTATACPTDAPPAIPVPLARTQACAVPPQWMTRFAKNAGAMSRKLQDSKAAARVGGDRHMKLCRDPPPTVHNPKSGLGFTRFRIRTLGIRASHTLRRKIAMSSRASRQNS